MKNTCYVCQKPKATLSCGVCTEHICKYCAQFLEEGSFSFLTDLPAVLTGTTFCGPCFEAKVNPELQAYQATMAQAKEIQIFYKNQYKETRLLKRWEDPLVITECDDQGETIMRLAFLAVKAGFNGVIDVVVESQKIRNGSYQTTKWRGTGIPTLVREDKLVKDRSSWHQPN